jgi:phosphate/sulfate permease
MLSCYSLLHQLLPFLTPDSVRHLASWHAGFALAFGGGSAVSWYEPRPDFPYVRGIVPIVVSWFLSPLLAALITLVFFLIIRTAVLRRQNSTKVAFWVLPFLIFFTIFVSLLFVLVSASPLSFSLLVAMYARRGMCYARGALHIK